MGLLEVACFDRIKPLCDGLNYEESAKIRVHGGQCLRLWKTQSLVERGNK